MKMVASFQKLGPHRFIGHLDLQRAMQRALRRADIPVVYSQGFNPHLMLSFAAPLSVGIEGEHEVMELPLQNNITETEFVEKMNAILPQGMKVVAAKLVTDDTAPAMARLAAAVYHISAENGFQALEAALPGFMNQSTIPYLKKTKSGERMDDFRPLVYNLTLKDGVLQAVLAITQQGTAKPDQLMGLLCAHAGMAVPRLSIKRARLLDERFAPLV